MVIGSFIGGTGLKNIPVLVTAHGENASVHIITSIHSQLKAQMSQIYSDIQTLLDQSEELYSSRLGAKQR
ncbi:hypothetical protein DPMN_119699 [Dreissena polymorpha]|uniref:Uncharacterized protein n=1 Tax=Dreissena polymorpha TaxID=45954 RepID=A0A9D4JRH3_DREPO|nr:hypothetical protein DPMN_119699 [Dreissena polymorpha]